MREEGFLDLNKVLLEVTFHNGRCITFPITSAVFAWDGSLGCYFGIERETLESFVPAKGRRRLKNGKTSLDDIFSEIGYVMGLPRAFILLIHPTAERLVTTQDGTECNCKEYQPILASFIQNIAVLVRQDDK